VCQRRKRYTSDLSDAQWAIIRELLPMAHGGPRKPIEIDMREAMIYLASVHTLLNRLTA